MHCLYRYFTYNILDIVDITHKLLLIPQMISNTDKVSNVLNLGKHLEMMICKKKKKKDPFS